MSVFHRGEQSMQAAYGMAEKMGEIGSRLFRDFMPDQHRQFFEELPFILVAARDSDGHPVASFLAGQPGFIQTSEREMTIRSKFTPGDWVAPLLKGDPVGLLGIMLHNRRRNRMNGLVFHNESGRLGISVVQSFGNCPKYIQTRERIKRVDRSAVQAEAINFKDPVLRQWIENSDTFFIASQAQGEGRSAGLDISHRGGKPGFVWFEDETTLVFPDFSGNFFFNTLGNLKEDPRCGLLWLSDSGGDLLQVQGLAQVILDRQAFSYPGAQAFIQVKLVRAQRLRHVSPYDWSLTEISPFLAATGR